jgi:hypothetical protein
MFSGQQNFTIYLLHNVPKTTIRDKMQLFTAIWDKTPQIRDKMQLFFTPVFSLLHHRNRQIMNADIILLVILSVAVLIEEWNKVIGARGTAD